MRTDSNGHSTCPAGQEQYEEFQTMRGKTRIQYDYRTHSGVLFSCIALSLDSARRQRDQWLEMMGEK